MSKIGFHVEVNAPQIDLVCGMEIYKTIEYKVKYKGKEYFFCSDGCKSHFEIDPEKYIG